MLHQLNAYVLGPYAFFKRALPAALFAICAGTAFAQEEAPPQAVEPQLREEVKEVVLTPAVLAPSPLPEAMVGQPLYFDFRPLLSSADLAFDASSASFSAQSLPEGLTLSRDGELRGKPAMTGTSIPLAISVDYKGLTSNATYTLDIEPVPANGIRVTPSFANFGVVDIGANGILQFVVTNVSDKDVSDLSFGELPKPFVRTGCSATLAKAANCTLTVTYSPATAGAHTATLNVSRAGQTKSVALSGEGRTFSLSENSLAFGDVPAGERRTLSFVLTNQGELARFAPTVQVTGEDVAASNNCPEPMPPGASCEVSVAFSPKGAQTLDGVVNVSFPSVPSQTVALSGVGRQPVLTTNSYTFDAGTVNIGSSRTLTRTLTNEGNDVANLAFSAWEEAFFKRETTCGATLAAGESCTISVTYAPTTLANASPSVGQFVVSAFRTSVTASYSGVGQALTVSDFDFGLKRENSGAYVLTRSVTNTSNLTLTEPSVYFRGSPAFAVVANGCKGALPAGASCSVAMRFTASAKTARFVGALKVGYAGLPVRLGQVSAETHPLSDAQRLFRLEH